MDVEDSIYLELISDDSLGVIHSRLETFIYWFIHNLLAITMRSFTSSQSYQSIFQQNAVKIGFSGAAVINLLITGSST